MNFSSIDKKFKNIHFVIILKLKFKQLKSKFLNNNNNLIITLEIYDKTVFSLIYIYLLQLFNLVPTKIYFIIKK